MSFMAQLVKDMAVPMDAIRFLAIWIFLQSTLNAFKCTCTRLKSILRETILLALPHGILISTALLTLFLYLRKRNAILSKCFMLHALYCFMSVLTVISVYLTSDTT